MNAKLKKTQNNNTQFEKPALAIEKLADADTVVGDPITTASGAQVIPLSSVTVVNLGDRKSVV